MLKLEAIMGKEDKNRAKTSRTKSLAEEIARLEEKHEVLEERLQELDQHKFLTSDEQRERKTIQKQKLQLKDKLRTLMAR